MCEDRSCRIAAWAAVGLSFTIALASLWLSGSAASRAYGFERVHEPLRFSNSWFVRPGINPDHAADGDPTTFWFDEPLFAERPFATPAGPAESIPPIESLYLQLQLGLSHSPGLRPEPLPLRSVEIWPGAQRDEESFRNYARPKRIRLQVMRQRVVDIDRDFEFPGLPQGWYNIEAELDDRQGMQTIELSDFPLLPASPGFPRDIWQYWLRVEILELYPGERYRQRVAISELRVVTADAATNDQPTSSAPGSIR